jgi:hypothetical protein
VVETGFSARKLLGHSRPTRPSRLARGCGCAPGGGCSPQETLFERVRHPIACRLPLLISLQWHLMRLWACWSVVGCLVALLAPAHARAQSVAPPVPTPVSARLHGEAPGLRFQVHLADPPDDPEDDRPIATCERDCRLDLLPGSYRLKVDSRDDSGELLLQVSEDSDFAVKTRSALRRRVGLSLGASGTLFSSVGALGLVLGALGALAHHDSSTCTSDECEQAWARSYLRWQKTSAVLFLVGVGPTVVGWIMFARNKKPSVTVTPTRRNPPILGAPQIGPIRILGAWGIGGSISF